MLNSESEALVRMKPMSLAVECDSSLESQLDREVSNLSSELASDCEPLIKSGYNGDLN
jgi:hypothetical protein